jgi:hypothetical protein
MIMLCRATGCHCTNAVLVTYQARREQGMRHSVSFGRLALLGVLMPILCRPVPAGAQNRSTREGAIPETWDGKALADWATPLAGINVRPSHISSAQYYALPVDNLKTWPVYLAGKEPPGYWQMLQRVGPQPLIEPEKLKTEADWLEAGRTVFEGMDHIHLRIKDPAFIETVRRGELLVPRADGTAANARWVPTPDGVALAFPACAGCHVLDLPNGKLIPGAPATALPIQRTGPLRPPLIVLAHQALRFVPGGTPVRMPPGPGGAWLYSAFGVPWIKDDIHIRLKEIRNDEHAALVAAGTRGGAIPRWNGSLFFPTKVPDLIGIKDRKYIDHTGTHLNRGIGDLMRYAALVSTAESTRFGPHNVLLEGAELPVTRRSDEALYALALYIESLEPPPNPNPVNADSKAGERIFLREGCAGCHTPPLYTNNKLTLAEGFTPPRDLPATLDVLPVSVRTDPGLALRTRKGTGFYKTPSLRGLWYRGHYLHDGSVASLEEMFNPDRVKDSHTPGGYSPPGIRNRAIKGHEFGFGLNERERSQLIAFLRTL